MMNLTYYDAEGCFPSRWWIRSDIMQLYRECALVHIRKRCSHSPLLFLFCHDRVIRVLYSLQHCINLYMGFGLVTKYLNTKFLFKYSQLTIHLQIFEQLLHLLKIYGISSTTCTIYNYMSARVSNGT